MAIDVGVELQQKEREPKPYPLPGSSELPHNLIEQMKGSNDALFTFLLKQSAQQFVRHNKEIPDAVPGSLRHIEQVRLVAQCIAEKYDTTPQEKERIVQDAVRFALTHDIGRIYEITTFPNPQDSHPQIGNEFLKSIQFGQKYERFALAHHVMGTGFGQEDLTKKYNLDDPKQRAEAIAQLDTTYGLAGIAALVGDIAKGYANGDKSKPVIAPLTKESGTELIEIQVQKGTYARHSQRHKQELQGLGLLIELQSFLKNRYQISYEDAIAIAQARQQEAEIDLQKAWTREIPLVQAA